MIIDRLS